MSAPKTPLQRAASAKATPDQSGLDVFSQTMGEVMRDQRMRQERMRHVQEFLSSPTFVDMRDQPMEVSDPPAAIAERKRDLDHRILVLRSILVLLEEERALLDKAAPRGEDAAPPA